MTRPRRAVVAAVAVVAAGALALAVPACSSKNKGQIVGRWATPDEGPGKPAVVYEFTEDGRFTIGAIDPGTGAVTPSQTGRYTLRQGNWVYTEFETPPELSGTTDRDWIEIDGDTMTIRDNDQTQTLTRMK